MQHWGKASHNSAPPYSNNIRLDQHVSTSADTLSRPLTAGSTFCHLVGSPNLLVKEHNP